MSLINAVGLGVMQSFIVFGNEPWVFCGGTDSIQGNTVQESGPDLTLLKYGNLEKNKTNECLNGNSQYLV